MAAITKSPPWETFYNEIDALFAHDSDVTVVKEYSGTSKKIKLLVKNHDKYRVLDKYVVKSKLFGVTTVTIEVIDSNAPPANTPSDDMRTLFKNNGAVSTVMSRAIPGGSVTYVAFNNGVVQFPDDNLADLNRNKTMLMEQIARDVFAMPIDGVYFCTDASPRTAKHDTYSARNKDLDELEKAFKNLFS